MQNSLEKYEDDQAVERKRLEIEIASAMSDDQVSTANEIADKFGLDVMEAVSLLNDHDFLGMVTLFQTAKTNLMYSGALNKLHNMLKSDDKNDSKFAIDRILKIKGAIKSGVELSFHLEGLLDEVHEKRVGASSKVTLDEDVTDLFPDERGTYGKQEKRRFGNAADRSNR